MTDISALDEARTFAMGYGHTRDIIIAREQASTDTLSFDFGEVPVHRPIANDIQDLVKQYLKNRIEEVQNAKRTIEEYKLSNINRDPTPIQHCGRDEFPMFDAMNELVTVDEFPDSSYEEPRPEFQALRLKDSNGKKLIAFREYTNYQIIEMDQRAWMMLQDQEYTKVSDGELIALPKKLDAIYFDGTFFVFNQRQFENIFDWITELESTVHETFNTIEDSDVLVHNMDEFKEGVLNHRTKMRKLYEVSQNGITSELDMDQAVTIIDEFGLNLDIRENADGEKGVEIPTGHDVWDAIRLFNNDHLISPVDSSRFQVFGKEKR